MGVGCSSGAGGRDALNYQLGPCLFRVPVQQLLAVPWLELLKLSKLSCNCKEFLFVPPLNLGTAEPRKISDYPSLEECCPKSWFSPILMSQDLEIACLYMAQEVYKEKMTSIHEVTVAKKVKVVDMATKIKVVFILNSSVLFIGGGVRQLPRIS